MSLPLQAVDRLFERLTATYGRQFLANYEGLDVAAVKTIWAHELGGFADKLQLVAWALEHLPARAPNVIEFRAICRQAPAPEAPRLPEPKADPERVRAELAKLGNLTAKPAASGLDWARRIVAKHQAGEPVSYLPLKMAREALAGKNV